MHCNRESSRKGFTKTDPEPQAECLSMAVLRCLWDHVEEAVQVSLSQTLLPPSSCSPSGAILVGVFIHAVWNFPAHYYPSSQMSLLL